MISIPRIAVFKPEEGDITSFQKLFQRAEYSVRFVTRALDILELAEEEEAPFDAIVLPLLSRVGLHGIARINEIRSFAPLKGLPIIGLALSKDRGIVLAFAEAGIDSILFGPFDPPLLHIQIATVASYGARRDRDAEIRENDASLQSPLLSLLTDIPQGLCFFSSNWKLQYANRAARLLLGITTLEEGDKLATQFEAIAPKSHSGDEEGYENRFSMSLPSTLSLTRAHGASIKVKARVTFSQSRYLSHGGYAVSLVELTEIAHLRHLLTQGARLKTLSLLVAAAKIKDLNGGSATATLSPLSEIEDSIKNEPLQSKVGEVLTPLLEILDLVIGTGVRIKVSIKDDPMIQIRSSDLFQIVGHLLLAGVEYAGGLGGLSIALVSRTLTISTDPHTVTAASPDPELAELIDKGAPLLAVPKDLALRYGFQVKEFRERDGSMSFTVIF